MISPELQLLLVRHGQAEANRPETFLGRIDSRLTTQVQAAALAKSLAAEPITAMYASPLQRARHTALVIAGPHALSPRLDDRLLEQDFGQWEGLTFAEVANRFPAGFVAWQADATCSGRTGGEVWLRASNVLLPIVLKG